MLALLRSALSRLIIFLTSEVMVLMISEINKTVLRYMEINFDRNLRFQTYVKGSSTSVKS